MKDYQGDFEPSYSLHLSQRAIAMVKSTTIFCLTSIIIAGMFLFYAYYAERFAMIGAGDDIYVFDRKDLHLNHCGKDGRCNPVNLTKSAIELAAAKPLQPVLGGSILTGFNKQQPPCPSCQPGQVQGMPQGQIPMQADVLGMGIPKAPSPLATQAQMEAAQQNVNASEEVEAEETVRTPPKKQKKRAPVIPFTAAEDNIVQTSAEEEEESPPAAEETDPDEMEPGTGELS